MTQTVADKLTKVVKAIEALPEAQREAVLDEIEEQVAGYASPQLTDAQRTEVMRRLAAPREHVPASEIAAILRRFNPAL